MSCYLHYRFEYRDGLVVEGNSADYHNSAREALNQRAARLKESGVPYTVDGLTLTYYDMLGTPEDLHCTVTLTWTDRLEEAR